jgi:uncharacterized membrane protein YgdD (TMEM256/DUF423 family)
MAFWSAALLFLSGLMGASGVALSAYAAHADGGANLTTSATFLLIHAAAVAGLCAGGGARRGLLQAASLLVIGAVLFSGDITLRTLTGASPMRMAAPTGGVMLIVGWLWVAAAAFVGRPTSHKQP